MKNLIFVFIIVFSISFASTLIIYNNAGLYESTKNIKGDFKIEVPNSIIVNSFYCSPLFKTTFSPALNINLNSILSSNKFITLNKEKYEVVSVKPLILKKDGLYFYNPDIKGFGFSKIPKIQRAFFEGFTKSATTLHYFYAFKGISYNVNYVFDHGKILSVVNIYNKTDYDFSKDEVYLVSQTMNDLNRNFESNRSFKALSLTSAPQKIDERYVYKFGKLSLKPDSNLTLPFINKKVDYLKYYKFYTTPYLSNLKAVITFKSPAPLPKGQWRVLETNKDTAVFSPWVSLKDISKNENLQLEYDYAYDVKGIETQTDFKKDGKVTYKTFLVTVYNYKNVPIQVKIYKNIGRSTVRALEGKYKKVGDFAVFDLNVKPNSRGEVKYVLKYPY